MFLVAAMAERSFAGDVEGLRLGDGDTFSGEGFGHGIRLPFGLDDVRIGRLDYDSRSVNRSAIIPP
jgi:hypothetical protein